MDSNRDYNKGGFLAFIFSTVFCLVFFVYISFIHPEIDLKEVPKEIPGQVKVNLATVEKPWVENEAFLAHAQKVYANNCATCHGPTGMGDGATGKGLNPPPRNFVEGKWKVGGTSKDLYSTITNGLPPSSMASFKHLSKVDRWSLVQFIRSITKNKVADNEAQMEAFIKTAE